MTQAAFLYSTGFTEAKVVDAVGHITVNVEAWVEAEGVRTLEKVDPTTVRFKTRNPEGTVTTWEYGTDADLVKTGVGSYTADVLLDKPGSWTFRWEVAGDYAQADEHTLVVNPSEFT